jgi:hypothetical protein
MNYPDGTTIEAGDLVKIDGRFHGKVVASMDTHNYLPGEEHWAYLGSGIMVNTDFAGMVHYTSDATDELLLVQRTEA